MKEIEKILHYLRWVAPNDVYARKRWVTEVEGTLIKDLIKVVGAKSYVEIGTANGYSAMWAALGLPKNGKVYTFDPVDRPKLYHDKDLKCSSLSSKITFINDKFESADKYLTKIQHPIVAFVDGNHNFSSVYNDWNILVSLLVPGDLIIFHDLAEHGANKAWSRILTLTPDSTSYVFQTRRVTGAILYRKESFKLVEFETNFISESRESNTIENAKRRKEVESWK